MTKPEDIDALIERVKGISGPDREVDFRIHIALIEDAVWPVRDRRGRVTNPDYRMSDYLRDYAGVINVDDQDFDFPRYTASIDAALALVERVLPGWCWGVGNASDDAPNRFAAQVRRMGIIEPDHQYHFAHTAPLAIILALLTAIRDQDHSHDKA